MKNISQLLKQCIDTIHFEKEPEPTSTEIIRTIKADYDYHERKKFWNKGGNRK